MKNLSLSQKMWSVISTLIIAFIGSVAFATYHLIEGNKSVDYVGETLLKRIIIASDIKDFQRQLALKVLTMSGTTDKELFEKTKAEYEDLKIKQNENINSFENIADKERLGKVQEYRTTQQNWFDTVDTFFYTKNQGDHEVALKIFNTKGASLRAKLLEMSSELVSFNNNAAHNEVKNIVEENKNTIMTTIAIAIVSVFLSFFIALFILRALTQTINKIISDLKDGSAQVTSASTQIAAASEELSQATTEQAASLEETAASVEEMSSMVNKNTENAKETAHLSEESSKASSQGQEVIRRMLKSIHEIDSSNNEIMTQVNESNTKMKDIVKIVEEISKKTAVINDIVNKTELLSFNASVEAARAGEHGKGFAVVAEEVGKLARLSGDAAEEISNLLSKSIESVNTVVEDTSKKVGSIMEKGKATIASGIKISEECEVVFQNISKNVVSVSGKAQEISVASSEQSHGIAEINKAMSELDQVTQQNASTSQECASAAEELSAQAESLNTTVQTLFQVVYGHNSVELPKTLAQKPKNVVELKQKPQVKIASKTHAPMKKVSGIPDYNDSGFEDV